MSKAFTRESDDIPERPSVSLPVSPLPAGAKNYITPDGAQGFRDALTALIEAERPRAAASGPESAELLQAIDQRIARLTQSLQTAVVVEAPRPPHEQVRFGAVVTVRNRAGAETVYRIVGVDETDVDRDWVSWVSPIARALINGRLGQRVRFRFPAGEDELEIVSIAYLSP
jgi:transcription elongation factor GreB